MTRPVTFSLYLAVGLFCLAFQAPAAEPAQSADQTRGAASLVPWPSEGNGTQTKGSILNQEIPDWKARWELARVLSYAQRYSESITAYRRLLQDRPGLLTAKIELAKVLAWNGQTTKAQTLLESIPAAELGPQAQIELADIYVAQKKYPQAVVKYERYLETHPQADQIRLKLAQVLSWMSKYDQSLRHYELLVKNRPNDIQLRRHYAQVLSWAGHYRSAIEQFRRSLTN